MFCPTCGKAYSEDIKTCGECGFDLHFMNQMQELMNPLKLLQKRRKLQARGLMIFLSGFLYFIFMFLLASMSYKLIFYLAGSVVPLMSTVYNILITLACCFPIICGVGIMTWLYGWVMYRDIKLPLPQMSLQNTELLKTKAQQALPSFQTKNDFAPFQPQTDFSAYQPPSVTEHTTRQMNQPLKNNLKQTIQE